MGSIPVAGAKQKAEGAFPSAFCLALALINTSQNAKRFESGSQIRPRNVPRSRESFRANLARSASLPAQVGIFIIDINTKNASNEAFFVSRKPLFFLHQVLKLLKEGINVLEFAVDRGEAHVCDLVVLL